MITKDDKNEQAKHHTVSKIKINASEFVVLSYFGRKIVSTNILLHLLSQYYDIHTPNINRMLPYLYRTNGHVL